MKPLLGRCALVSVVLIGFPWAASALGCWLTGTPA